MIIDKLKLNIPELFLLQECVVFWQIQYWYLLSFPQGMFTMQKGGGCKFYTPSQKDLQYLFLATSLPRKCMHNHNHNRTQNTISHNFSFVHHYIHYTQIHSKWLLPVTFPLVLSPEMMLSSSSSMLRITATPSPLSTVPGAS